MAKKKRKSRKKQAKQLNIKYELNGLLCIAISIIAILQLGVVGQPLFTCSAFCWRVVYFMLIRFIGVRSLAVLEEENAKLINETKGRVVLYYRKHIAAFSRAAV